MLLDTGERDNYKINRPCFCQLVTEKTKHNTTSKFVFYDSTEVQHP